MDKLQYLVRQIAKTNKKNYENYVVTRIWHRLDNLEIKFVTQQYIAKSDGNYALTDMYFPQLGLHVEVDEPHHHRQISEDIIREQDIVNVTQHEIIRIDISKGIDAIHGQIEGLVQKIIQRISDLGDNFVPWDLKKEHDPHTFLDLGYIDVKDNVAFERSVDAVNCFGYNHKGFQRAGIRHPIEKGTKIWFPKLYPNDGWINKITSDEQLITERPADPAKIQEHMNQYLTNPEKRIVFARVKGPLGDTMYRFKGIYDVDQSASIDKQCMVWKRIAERVKTYRYKEQK